VEHVRTLSDLRRRSRASFDLFLLEQQSGREKSRSADALTGLCVAMIEEFNVTPKKRDSKQKQPR